MRGQKLLIVEPLRVDYDEPKTAGGAGVSDPRGMAASSGHASGTGGGTFQVTGRAIVAVDTLGAGEGQLVLIVQGSSARMAEGFNKLPVDALVVGIVDEAIIMGKKVE